MFQPYLPAYQRASRVRLPASVCCTRLPACVPAVPACQPECQPCPFRSLVGSAATARHHPGVAPGSFILHKSDLTIRGSSEHLGSYLVTPLPGKFGLWSSGATPPHWTIHLRVSLTFITEKVQSEIEKVIGSGEPQMTHRKHMPYTDAVIHEVQRFANIVPTNLPHQTTKDITLKGFFLPKGSYIIPSLTSVLRDDKYFKKPDEFYPQHFLDADGNFIKNEAFLPFSAGKRSCAGENMGKMELFLFFTKLLQNFTFTAPPMTKLDLTAAIGFTLRPQEHEICAVPRY
ncbi:unnamed protein product [Ranitomeya imitator]|uniref:Cytochrome P450 n=1 Tax=Ranitomeya imitator TaxID=111125 RepID=A0ABN9KQE7_9NEOB|nr:unnamed protein product [Ranitomeya imitator]